MDRKSLELLEFHRVRQIIAGYTAFGPSRELALCLQPVSDYETAQASLHQSAEARRLLELDHDLSLGDMSDVTEMVRAAARGKLLEPQTALEVARTVSSLRQLRQRLAGHAPKVPRLWEIASGIVELEGLERDIDRRLTPGGEVRDNASPQLLNLRRQLQQRRDELLSRLENLLHSSAVKKLVQEPIITEREGRHVIPVKVEFRREIKGIVHDASNTGATVFIEPWSTVEMGNEVRELTLAERREVERILAELSANIGAHEGEIGDGIARAAEIDLNLAKARYARRAHASEPNLSRFEDNNGTIRLVNARHPLLGAQAVPLSLELGRDFRILLITGPNTGGKTVTLKTIGLLSLMALAGLPIPAAPESAIPVFRGVYADIGDEQSIEQTLSSFSWHMGNIVRILGQTTTQSLVLLDELGTSTDPVEGAALARSILVHLLANQALGVVTTHYGDLKAFAHTTPGLQNASLDFDPATLLPTYRLSLGVPGGSNALVTAARLGLSPEIIDRARGLLSRSEGELESLLADLNREKARLEDLRREAETTLQAASEHRRELEERLGRLTEEERRLLRETRDQVTQAAAGLHRLIREAESELKKERTRERIERARKTLAAAHEQLAAETWQIKPEVTDDAPVAPGDTVVIKDYEIRATVVSVSDSGEVELQSGATRIRLGLDRVQRVAPAAATGPEPAGFRLEAGGRPTAYQLDLRGKRADEIEPAVDSYLNDASLANLSEVRIVHGTATGTVRRIVRDFLATHPLVKSFRPGGSGEGGDGATVVRL